MLFLSMTGITRDLHADRPAVILKPGDALRWTAQPRNFFNLGMTWSASVGPDGSLTLGPYRIPKVTGLSLEQAEAIIDQQILPTSQNSTPIAAGATVSSFSHNNQAEIPLPKPGPKESDLPKVDHPRTMPLPTLPSTRTTGLPSNPRYARSWRRLNACSASRYSAARQSIRFALAIRDSTMGLEGDEF